MPKTSYKLTKSNQNPEFLYQPCRKIKLAGGKVPGFYKCMKKMPNDGNKTKKVVVYKHETKNIWIFFEAGKWWIATPKPSDRGGTDYYYADATTDKGWLWKSMDGTTADIRVGVCA